MLVLVLKVTAVLVAVRLLVRWLRRPRSNNPFASDARQSVRPLVTDQKARDRVIKQSFSPDRVPADLDAIVIGSGIGGLSVAAIMAKAGKKVLVLEQHDQAGGCCHTFIDKGYEFDVGIHYIGNLNSQTSAKTLIDPADPRTAAVGGARRRVRHGRVRRQALLAGVGQAALAGARQEAVPRRHGRRGSAVRGGGEVQERRHGHGAGEDAAGVAEPAAAADRPLQPRLRRVQAETNNKDLQALFMYCFRRLRHQPRPGGSYPVGGASEIAFHMIPVIEEAGGRVLVRAEVKELLMDELRSTVVGVKVAKGSSTHEIRAPMVISNAEGDELGEWVEGAVEAASVGV
ncbi:all-trans-retinol 13,14-reductase-like [Pollicipes pollicipes]|uniref:all-trans-retinol 13,14-reductase-like n=1 Tax=Pollicipes pollicipes TaxID=41117 RepID=UPI0018857B7F|nr:all-trans-retinol 13,14-reductase-like [Pollicipes pollicipes]